MKKSILILSALIASVATMNAQSNLKWAVNLGGSGDDIINSMVLDANGNIYTTGFFTGTADFDPGVGTTTLTSAGVDDAFIAKYDGNGKFKWARQIGGTALDHGYGIAVDALGNVYTIGEFQGTVDFNTDGPVDNHTSLSGYDMYISKLDSLGNYIWAKQFGSANIDGGRAIAVDPAGNVYTTGVFRWTVDFDPGAGNTSLTTKGGDDAFVCKFNSDGTFGWVAQLGSTGGDFGYAIATDAKANVYTTGTYSGTIDFDPGLNTQNLTPAGGSSEVFISKLDSTGKFKWAKSFGGSNITAANGIAIDVSGNVLTTGFFWGTGDFDPGANTSNLTAIADKDIFVSKLDSSGNFVWAKAIAGTGHQAGSAITTDASGAVYYTGYFWYTIDFDPGAGTHNLTTAWGGDVFTAKLNADGSFGWAKSIGSVSDDGGQAIAVDGSGNVYTAGGYGAQADFDPSSAITVNLTSHGSNDAFIQKIGQASDVGISENKQTSDFSIYPNPNSGKFEISGSGMKSVEIYNMFGQKVFESKSLTQIDVSELAKGIYFVNILTDGSSVSKRIILN